MKPADRAPFSAIDDRPPLRLPDGGRMILWPLMSLEVWDIDRPMARTVLPPPQPLFRKLDPSLAADEEARLGL